MDAPFSQSQAQSSVRINTVAFPDVRTLNEISGKARLASEEFHVKPNDICLTRAGRRMPRQSSVLTPVIHCDPFSLSLKKGENGNCMTTDYGAYLCDKYDARGHADEILNRMQASVLVRADEYYPPFQAEYKRMRQNVLEFVGVSGKSYKKEKKGTVGTTMYTKYTLPIEDHDTKTIKDLLVQCIEKYEGLRELYDKGGNVDLTSNNPVSVQSMPFRYAGLCQNEIKHVNKETQLGDTSIAVNVCSVTSIPNGPFEVYPGDLLVWISHIELGFFDKDTAGTRLQRVNPDLQIVTALPTGTEDATDDVIRTKTIAHIPGQRFLVVPFRRIVSPFTDPNTARIVGRALSYSGPNRQVDVLNGAGM